MKTAVAAQDLTKTYSDGKLSVHAVSSVDLVLREGELVGLLGPSGSGKTTLLSVLGCILRPTSGSLKIYGTEIVGLDEKILPSIRKQYISFVFQGFNLFHALTAYDNVVIALQLKGVEEERADSRARELLEMVGLADRLSFLPRDLSGGQKQRVAIARALAAETPVILADEPTGNLDLANGRRIMEVLKDLAVKQNKCIIVATHDNRIDDLFDRILLMEDGRIQSDRARGVCK